MYSKIISLARLYLGDLDETKYSQTVMEIALSGALLRVGTDISVDFDFNAGSTTITPVPNGTQANLIGTDLARLILIGEYNAEALAGGGIIWKSGLSSISLAGMERSMQTAVKLLKEAYEHYLDENRIGNAEAVTIDTYITGVSELVSAN